MKCNLEIVIGKMNVMTVVESLSMLSQVTMHFTHHDDTIKAHLVMGVGVFNKMICVHLHDLIET